MELGFDSLLGHQSCPHYGWEQGRGRLENKKEVQLPGNGSHGHVVNLSLFVWPRQGFSLLGPSVFSSVKRGGRGRLSRF